MFIFIIWLRSILVVKCGNVIKEKSNQLRWSTKRTKSTIIRCSKCNLYLPSHGCNSPTWSISWPNYSLTSWPESLCPIFQFFGQKIWNLFWLQGHSCGPRNSSTWPNYSLTSWPESLWPIFQFFGQKVCGLFWPQGHICSPKNSPKWSIFWPKYPLTS